MYVQDKLQQAAMGESKPALYWRPARRWSEEPQPWSTQDIPDGEDYWAVSNYEYIAYDETYVYVWVVYDCYSGSFHPASRNGPLPTDSQCEAG